MKRMIFGGTTEGRELAARHLAAGDEVIVCVASGYGQHLLPEGVTAYARPMGAEEMRGVIARHMPDELIDATHPFATQVTRNIRACAEALGIPCRRVSRQGDAGGDFGDYVTWAGSAREVAALLAPGQGNVMLTTGSNTLSVYAAQIAPERLYVRVLPTADALQKCAAAGILPSHIIAMQGPFSAELNAAIYEHCAIQSIVSKDSGDVGGVREKVIPALARGIHVVIIKRPMEE